MGSSPTPVFCLYVLLCLLSVTTAFNPTDHYLINCGAHTPSAVDLFKRRFTSDLPERPNSQARLTSTRTIQLTDPTPNPGSSLIYHTARAFTRPSKYTFVIRDRGTHLVRLHFFKFSFPNFNILDAQFHVLANGYVLLNNFTAEEIGKLEIVKDFMIWVDSAELEITFVPFEKSKFAFVNAIEVISAPKDLVNDLAQYVSTDKNVQISGLLKNGFEVMHRINVGGPKVTPFNDSLWRTWVEDETFLKSSDLSSRVVFTGRIMYTAGGASREVGPDNVYNTARVIRSMDDKVPDSKIIWEFPVVDGYRYLVRMHFCDIASVALGMLYFNVYVNGILAFENLDLSRSTYGVLSSPFYADIVVDVESATVLTVSVGPSNMSLPRAVDAILNGVEIMKINNSMSSFDGDLCVGSILKSWKSHNVGFAVPLLAAVVLLLIASVVLQRRRAQLRDYVSWSPLPVDVSDINMKYGNHQFSSGKV